MTTRSAPTTSLRSLIEGVKEVISSGCGCDRHCEEEGSDGHCGCEEDAKRIIVLVARKVRRDPALQLGLIQDGLPDHVADGQ